jgi:transcriptional regulator with XRE-family HTH domain
MPRQPSFKHPLRTVRNRLGMSQAEFGRQFGVSGYTIQQIENGRLPLPPALAANISLSYGLDKKQLLNGEDPEHPRLQSSKIEFRKEHYERLSRVRLDEVKDRLDMLCLIVKLLGDAANEKQRFRNIAAELAETLKAKAQQFGLEDEMLSLLAAYGFYPRHPDHTRQLYDMLFGSAYVPVAKIEAGRNKLRRKSIMPSRSPQSSAADKSPKKPVPHRPRLGRDNAGRKRSGSRHAQVAG